MTKNMFKPKNFKGRIKPQDLFNSINEAVFDNDGPKLNEILKKLHGADIADFLEQASKAERLSIIRLWDSKLRGDVLVELGEGVLIELLEEIASCNLIEAIQGLQTDEIISLLEKIGWAKKETILNSFSKPERDAIERSLKYSEESAGRLMQLEVVNAPEHWNVGNAIDFLRANSRLAKNFYEIIVLSPKGHPIGVVPLGILMSSPRKVSLKSLMKVDFKVIVVN